MNVVFHMTPESTQDKREWDKFPALARYLITRYGAIITVVGSERDRYYVDEFESAMWLSGMRINNLVGQTTLDELIQILKGCDLLVCVNSFVMHLGVTLGVKMFAIVGATDPGVVLPPAVPHVYCEYAKDIPFETVAEQIDQLLSRPA